MTKTRLNKEWDFIRKQLHRKQKVYSIVKNEFLLFMQVFLEKYCGAKTKPEKEFFSDAYFTAKNHFSKF